MARYSLGIEVDDAAARVVVADIRNGEFAAQAVESYAPQGPQNWVESAAQACRRALQAGAISLDDVVGIGIACTSHIMRFTMQPAWLPGLPEQIPIAGSVPGTHAAVPGAGVASPSTLVMSVGSTRSIHLLNSRTHAVVAGVAGPVRDGILPGYFGYEIEQDTRNDPLTSAMELRSICDNLRSAGVQVRRFVFAGPAAEWLQTYADVLDARIKLPQSDQPVVLGAAILGCLAAGAGRTGFASMSQAIHAMARLRADLVYRPDLRARKAYDKRYEAYRARLPIPSEHRKP